MRKCSRFEITRKNNPPVPYRETFTAKCPRQSSHIPIVYCFGCENYPVQHEKHSNSATVNDEAMKLFFHGILKASWGKESFCVKLLFFAAVVFELLSAMKINFSYRSLYRHSPRNFHFFLLCATERVNEREKKTWKQYFYARKRISNSRKVSFWRSRCFFFSFELSQTFIHTFVGEVLLLNASFFYRTEKRVLFDFEGKGNWKK